MIFKYCEQIISFPNSTTIVEYNEHLCTAMDQSNVNRVKNNTDLGTIVTLDTKNCFTISPTREDFLTQKKI
jgi:hypothetical protein